MFRNLLATLQINRKSPFDKLVLKLEQSALPIMQKWSKELEYDFAFTQVRLSVARSDYRPRLPQNHSYHITIECWEKGAVKRNLEDLIFSIDLRQLNAKSNPTISAYIGMLVDEESGDDWGIRPISTLFSHNQKADEESLRKLDNSLPDLYQSLQKSLERRGAKQVWTQ